MSSLGELINIFSKLPSLGPRSARRIVLYLLKNKEKIIPTLITTIENVKSELSYCHLCGNVDVVNPCNICADDKRKNGKLCIVEDIGDLWAIEKSKAFNGTYHVLGGVLSAMDGVGPDQLNISSLLKRLESGSVKEVIIATNATTEGQITGQYIADECSKFQILITRLAQGIPIGGDLDYTDNKTLVQAFNSRQSIR